MPAGADWFNFLFRFFLGFWHRRPGRPPLPLPPATTDTHRREKTHMLYHYHQPTHLHYVPSTHIVTLVDRRNPGRTHSSSTHPVPAHDLSHIVIPFTSIHIFAMHRQRLRRPQPVRLSSPAGLSGSEQSLSSRTASRLARRRTPSALEAKKRAHLRRATPASPRGRGCSRTRCRAPCPPRCTAGAARPGAGCEHVHRSANTRTDAVGRHAPRADAAGE